MAYMAEITTTDHCTPPTEEGPVLSRSEEMGTRPRSTLIITIFDHLRLVPTNHNQLPDDCARAEFYDELTNLIRDLLLSEETPKPTGRSTVGIAQFTISASKPLDCAALRKSPPVALFEAKHDIEIVLDQCSHNGSSVHRPIKLALFDMDSTLINEEVIDELARSIGISDTVSAITTRAMNGDIDFATSLKERVAMLKGVPTTVWEDLKKTVTIAEGAKELVTGLKKRGVYTGVVSGGFTPMAEWLKGQLGLDVAIANHLLESPPTDEHPFPHLFGRLNPDFPIVTPELKKSTLLQLSAERSIPLSETLAVGDGSNDLLMLGAAGLGIAWRAKEKVQIAAPMRLNGKSLADLLYLLGDTS